MNEVGGELRTFLKKVLEPIADVLGFVFFGRRSTRLQIGRRAVRTKGSRNPKLKIHKTITRSADSMPSRLFLPEIQMNRQQGDSIENIPSSAFAASATNPVSIRPTQTSKNLPPPPMNGSEKKASPQQKNNQYKHVLKTETQLTGTLEPVTYSTGTRWTVKGTWKFKDEENTDPQYLFELVSKETSASVSMQPLSGMYSGFFCIKGITTNANGTTSTKLTKIIEKSVKLEFRKQKDQKYYVFGFGKNEYGDFTLNGIMKPISRGQFNQRFTFGVKKMYTDLSTPISRSPPASSTQKKSATFSSGKHSKSPSSLQPRTQDPPDPKRAAASPSQQDSVRPKKKQKKSPEPDSETESESSQDHSRRRRDERSPVPKVASPANPPILSQLSTASTGVDRVNGKGMWHAWTRSFDTPLLALLDIFDNAVDASWTLMRDESDPNTKKTKPKIRVDLDRYGRNGVVIRNASTYIPPLHQVLQVYKSSKAGEGDNSIGENGIGVKHACASLSGLSFVFTKTTDPNDESCTLSMGILMQELQRDDGIVLPSMAFPVGDNGSLDEVKEALENHCIENPDTWGKAMKAYGDGHFEDGIERCLQHMDHLRGDRNWRESDNVFAVVLANLKHAAFDDSEGEDSEMEVIRVDGIEKDSAMAGRNANGSSITKYHAVRQGGETDVDEDEQRSLSLLNTLKTQLPYLYLHLHDLDICVEKTQIESIYWERRLSDLTKFELQLPQTERWNKFVRDSEGKLVNEMNHVFNITKPEESVRFFCGFDPYRCQNSKEAKKSSDSSDDEAAMSYVPGELNNGSGLNLQGNNSPLKVYTYSRQSGRLIKVQNDPRSDLRISSGSTDFCQGLTVIIDDHNGTLPLNPTKQDTAYGHSKYGQTHAENLKEWTAAITHFYWNYHYEQFGSSKVAVTQAVAKSRASLEKTYKEHCTSNNKIITPLCRGDFISYPKIEFKLTSFNNVPKIRTGKTLRKALVPVVDQHSTISRLVHDAEVLALANRPKASGFAEQKLIKLRSTNQNLTTIISGFRNDITTLNRDLQKRKQENARDKQEIHLLKKENKRLYQKWKEHTDRAELLEQKYREIQEQLRNANLVALVGSPQPSQPPLATPTTDTKKGDPEILGTLKRQVDIYKKRSERYEKELEAKKKYITSLTEEKSRFENRIQELEEAQLTLDSYGDNHVLQF